MAENEVDSGQSAGTEAVPNASGSQGNGVSGGSFDASKLQSTLETVLKRVDEIDKSYKTFQQGKDRGVNKATEEVAELKRKIAEIEKLKKAGLDDEGAYEELSFREDVRALREQLSKLNPAQSQPAGNSEALAEEAGKVFAKYGVDPNDPVAIGFTSLKGAELKAAVADYAFEKSKHSPPDSSTATSLQSTPAKAVDQSALIAKLHSLQKEPTRNRVEIAKLEKELGW